MPPQIELYRHLAFGGKSYGLYLSRTLTVAILVISVLAEVPMGQSCFPQLEKSIGHITCVYLSTKRVCWLRNYQLILVITKVVVLKKWKPGNSRKCYIIAHSLNPILSPVFCRKLLAPVKLAKLSFPDSGCLER
jgi:hypothetical protein